MCLSIFVRKVLYNFINLEHLEYFGDLWFLKVSIREREKERVREGCCFKLVATETDCWEEAKLAFYTPLISFDDATEVN